MIPRAESPDSEQGEPGDGTGIDRGVPGGGNHGMAEESPGVWET